ncbi:hypothetical protein [Micromonospora zingiberis]|nr:hypothetical protein [Micromonospora zingiberis]
MSEAAENSSSRAQWHRLLLSLAGRLPDEVVAQSRTWLADGRTVETAQAVVLAALAHQVGVTDHEATLLAAALGAAGEDTRMVAAIGRVAHAVAPAYGLAPTGPDVLAEHGDDIPFRMDLSVRPAVPGGPDAVDTAAVVWCANNPQAYALWRSWRYPADDTPQGPARRLYLVQARDEARLITAAAGLQATLTAHGERDPQVEAFVDEDTLPAYQQRALEYSALLWSVAPAEVPRLVPDVVSAGPGPADAARVAAYLDAGRPLRLIKDAYGARAELTYRTDGTWIWPATAGQPIRERRHEPHPPLLAHIRDRAYHPPTVGTVAMHRALCALYRPPPVPPAALDVPRRWSGRTRRTIATLAALALLGAVGATWIVAGSGAGSTPTAVSPADLGGAEATPAAPPSGTSPPVSARAPKPDISSTERSAAPRPSTSPEPPSPPANTPSAAVPSVSRSTAVAAGQTRLIVATAVLRPGQHWSTDRLSLAVTDNGEVVLRDRGRSVWASGSTGRNVRELVFQADGNLVLYASDGSTIWSSGTPGNDGATLTLGGDGNLSISIRGRTLWQTATGS